LAELALERGAWTVSIRFWSDDYLLVWGCSTLATSLFRIIEPTHGEILIDGIDVLKIGLDDLRSNLAIIPQDPVLFKNTVRYNLDPFGKHDDSVLWEALDKVFLKQAISDLPDKLDTLVQENGANV
jgi:ABC-type multidrug transport system fused ATPase/permease subunit